MSKYQIMPPLSDEQYGALKADIATAGVRVPIEVDENGEVIDGHHRRAIAMELGIECPEVVVRGLEEFEKFDRAFVLNATRRHFDRDQKRAVIVKSLMLHPRLADREHARRCGVSHPTVADVRRALEAAGRLESFTSRVSGDGRERPARNEPTRSQPADSASSKPAPAAELPANAGGEIPEQPETNTGHPVSAEPGDAAEHSSHGSDELGDEVDKDESPDESSSAARREPQPVAGVSPPAAPARVEDEDDPERVNREMRTRMSERFCEAVVTLSQGAASRDPIQWLEDIYLPGAYKMRGLPGVNGCFDPESLRLLASRIHMIADHLEETGTKLP